MRIGLKKRLHYFWTRHHSGNGWWHLVYCPYPPPWWLARPKIKDETKELKTQIEMLKKEIKASEEKLKKVDRTK
jgi:hypothetical protein